MTAPRAGALDFLVRWYALPANERHTPDVHQNEGITKVLQQAAEVAVFLEKDDTDAITTVMWRWGQVLDQVTKDPVSKPLPAGGHSMVQLRDTEQVSFTIEALDAKGYQVAGETFSASIDNTAAATVAGPDDSGTFVVSAVAPGSAVGTVTDGTLSATFAVDVVTGDVATIDVAFGTPEPEPAPTPVPDPVPTP